MKVKNSFRQTICPIEPIQDNQVISYSPTPCQKDVWTGYQTKLRYEFERKKMNLEQKDVLYQKRLQFEQELKALNLHYQTYLKMLSTSVYKDSAGKIMLTIEDGEKRSLAKKILLNVSDYTTRIYVSFFPVERSALEVSWAGKGKKFIVFPCCHEGVDPNVFLKKLKKNGVLLLVSGRTEKQAANALLAYSFDSAEYLEIPNNLGWNTMGDGAWHYARKNELTMSEVLKNGGIR